MKNKIKKITLIFFVVFLFITNLQGQNITGRVIDEQNQPIEFVNVALFSRSDSAIITGTITDNKGAFSLQVGLSGDHFLQFSFIGYKTLTTPAETNKTITLKNENKELEDVIVKASRKLFKLENGNLVATVKNTPLETLTNANEVISQLPFLTGKDGDFTVFGRGKPVIYINNRLVRDNKELEQLSPGDIKSIRVINSPDATYDATVKAVIKITTEKPTGEGLSGMIYARGNQASVFSGGEYISLNYRNGPWDVFASSYYNHNNYKTNFDAIQNMTLDGDNYQQVYKTKERGGNNSLNSFAGINFNPNKDHSAGIRYNNYNIKYQADIDNDILYTEKNAFEKIQQKSSFCLPQNTHNINAYYNGIITEKLSLNTNSDVVIGSEDNKMNSHYTQSPDEVLRTKGTRDSKLYAVKGILSYDVNKGTLNAGGEYTHTRVSQTYNINNQELGIENTNDKAIQNRLAFFATYQVQLDKIGLNAGVRYENINMDYYEKNVKNEDQSRKYNELFPNISASYTTNNIHAMIAYERKIDYPSYNLLRSNIQYSSPFLYESGNPLLKPKVENTFSAVMAWKDVQVMASYSLNKNDFFFMPTQYADQPIILLRFDNVKRSRNASVGTSYTPVIGLWRPSFEIGGMWQRLDIGNMYNKYNQPIFLAKWFNTFTLPQKWTFRIDGQVTTNGNAGVALNKSSWGIDLKISKTILQDKLSFQLSANDIFKTNTSKWEMDYGVIRLLHDRNTDSRSVSLTVSYRFNPVKSKYKGQQSSDEIKRL